MKALQSNAFSELEPYELEKLHDWGFVVDQDIDETKSALFQYNKHIYSSSDLSLVLIPTTFCNFRCVYCPQPHHAGNMNETVINSILLFIKKNTKKYRRIFIEWFGGEPLLRKKEIIEMMKEIRLLCQENRIILTSSMTTNGYELDLDTFERLVDGGVRYYQISIDGNEETHNKLRPHMNNADSFKKIFDNLTTIKEKTQKRHFTIGVRINVSPENFSKIDSMINCFQNTFLDDNRFQLMWQWVRDWGGPSDSYEKRKELDSTADICKEFYETCINRGLLCVDYMSCKSGMAICEACKLNGYIINFDGKIFKCAMMLDDPVFENYNHVGKLLDNGVMEINDNKMAQWLVPKSIDKKCLDCVHYPMCMGVPCPLSLNFRKKKICLVDKNLSEFNIRNIRLHHKAHEL